MFKKQYISPSCEIVNIDMTTMICASMGKGDSIVNNPVKVLSRGSEELELKWTEEAESEE